MLNFVKNAGQLREMSAYSSEYTVAVREICGEIYYAACCGKLHADWYSRPEHDITEDVVEAAYFMQGVLRDRGFHVTITRYNATAEFKKTRLRVHISWED